MPEFTQHPLLPQGFSLTFPSRFFSKVQITDCCWFWLGATGRRNGYGYIGMGRDESGTILAHRASWLLHFGFLPERSIEVCHSCDFLFPVGDITYRRCVNPAHLFIGTKQENITDAVTKGRNSFGERNWHKLTEAEVAQIIHLYDEGAITLQALGDRFGVSYSQIWKIVRRLEWRHIRV